MTEAAKSLFLIFSALFPIVDPLGGSPIFLLMTPDYEPGTRRALSWRIAVDSFFLLVGSYFIGAHILSFFGISLPVVQVGGGLIVISTGWTLLKQGSTDDQKGGKQRIEPKDPFHNAFYPLTLPLTVGPGSISVAITLGANAPYHHGLNLFEHFGGDCGLCVCSPFSIFLCYGFADRLGRILGKRGSDGHLATHIIPAGVHRRADSVERHQRALKLDALARPLNEAVAPTLRSAPAERSLGVVNVSSTAAMGVLTSRSALRRSRTLFGPGTAGEALAPPFRWADGGVDIRS